MTEPDALQRHRTHEHADCFACSDRYIGGLHLQCALQDNSDVTAEFQPQQWMTGYDGRLHGGIVAMLLDSAMTQCLFAHDHVAVTAVLHVRYRCPAPVNAQYHVRAALRDSRHGHHRAAAWLTLNDTTIADAEAQFIENNPGPVANR